MKKIGLSLLAVLITCLGVVGVIHGAATTYGSGTFVKADASTNKVTVRSIDKKTTKTKTYGITKNTILTINGVPATLKAFKSGIKVTFAISGGRLISLKGWSVNSSRSGAIAPETKIRTGIVSQLDGNKLWVRLAYGQVKPFILTNSTFVLKDGKKSDIRAVLEGDRVKMYFDSITTSSVAKLEIQEDLSVIKGLYKGKLQRYDQKTSQLIMTDVQVFKEAKWQPYKPLVSIHSGTDYPVYAGYQKLDAHSLAKYSGSYIFVATKMYADREQAERVIVESQNERTYSEQIDSYNFNTEQISLKGNLNFQIHQGTLLIRNGRFVDKYGLQQATHAFVSGDSGTPLSSRFANIVYVYNEGIEKSQLQSDGIFWGTLDTILDGDLWLKDFYALSGHRWEYQFTDVSQLKYDNESVIMDFTNGLALNPHELDGKNYAVDEQSPYALYHGLKDWFGYVYVRDDRIVQLGMWRYPDNIPAQTVTIGIVDGAGSSVITIADPKDWSASRSDWIQNGISLSIDISKAVVMKDAAPAKSHELEQGDNIYVVRDGTKGIVVIVN